MARSGSIRAGRAYVELSVQDRLQRGLRQAEQRLRHFGASVRRIGTRVAGIGAAITAPLLAATRSFAGVGDNLDKMAARTGVGVEALSELGFAAEQSGASLEAMGDALFRMRRRVANAATGSGPAVRALDALGLSAEKLTQLPVDQQFKLIADRLAGLGNPSEAAQYAFEILGDGAKALVPLMAEGAESIEALQQQARDLGLTVTADAAASAAKLTDQWNMLSTTLKAAKFAIGEALAPAIGDVVERISRAVVVAGNWIRQNQALVVAALKAGAALIGVGAAIITLGLGITVIAMALGGLATVVGGLVSAFGLLGAAVAALVTPIGQVTFAVVALGVHLARSSEVGASALRWLAERFTGLRETAVRAFGAIGDALAAGDISLAARVLWLTLRKEWQDGISDLTNRFTEFGFAIERVAIRAFAGIQQAWLNVRHWFESNFPNFTAWMAKMWAEMTHNFQTSMETARDFMARRFVELQGMLDETLNVAEAKQHLDSETRRAHSAIERSRRAAIAEADRRAGRSDAEREAELAEDIRRVREAEADRLEELAGRQEDAATEVSDALAEAREQWEQAVAEARQAREVVGDEGPDRLNPAGDLLDAFDDILNNLRDVARDTVQVRGTFNVAAVQSLQASRTEERIADATEQTARNTRRIERQMGEGGPVFT